MDINIKIDLARKSLEAYEANGGTELAVKLLHDWSEDIRPFDSELADRMASA